MRAKYYEDIEIADVIFIELPSGNIRKSIVEKILKDEGCVKCKGIDMDIYPNTDDQYIVDEE